MPDSFKLKRQLSALITSWLLHFKSGTMVYGTEATLLKCKKKKIQLLQSVRHCLKKKKIIKRLYYEKKLNHNIDVLMISPSPGYCYHHRLNIQPSGGTEDLGS